MWSAFDVIGHLIHGEKTDWIPRTKQILAGGDDAVFVPFDRTGHEASSVGKSIDELLEQFKEDRTASLRELRGMDLGPAELGLCGIHPEFGSVRLDELLSAWTAHDLAHIAQVARAMARGLRTATGPWRQYLRIVEPR